MENIFLLQNFFMTAKLNVLRTQNLPLIIRLNIIDIFALAHIVRNEVDYRKDKVIISCILLCDFWQLHHPLIKGRIFKFDGFYFRSAAFYSTS
jgi:hypothetical protein